MMVKIQVSVHVVMVIFSGITCVLGGLATDDPLHRF
jgi:hypothetical protein